ncbi:TPA: BRO-like protein [Vibrio vulnificus]|uniref:BRO-N domain-containing protein n=1 Tax=Vibrio vulnificus TaxID=672 RepID=UPI0006AD2D3D|nr:BRO family protein [Vibrio vulnificus]HDY8067444.1 BRO-like protein [Vibrio vulnificus]
MKNELIEIIYEGENGRSDIRTYRDYEDILYVSLVDVIRTLNRENREHDERHIIKSMAGILKAQLQALDSDEYIMVPVVNGAFSEEKEVFVTQPGLYRVLSSDRSYAGKKFQRWLFHDVIPALTKYGEYPAPVITQDSEVKKLAKLVLMEIEQREEAEKRINEKFLAHEKQLNLLGDKLHSIETESDISDYFSVAQYCSNNLIDKTHEQLIFGWCIKICAEEGEKSHKRTINGRKELFFPLHVIAAAVSHAKKA